VVVLAYLDLIVVLFLLKGIELDPADLFFI